MYIKIDKSINDIKKPNFDVEENTTIIDYIKKLSTIPSIKLIDSSITTNYEKEKKFIENIKKHTISIDKEINQNNFTNITKIPDCTTLPNEVQKNICNIITNRKIIKTSIITNIDTLKKEYEKDLKNIINNIGDNDNIRKNLRADYLYELNQKLR